MTEALVLREDQGRIAILTLNRPQALNALSDALMAQLQATLDDLAQDSAIRVVILRGAGKAFCAGHDLREMQAGRAAPDGGQAYFADLFRRCSTLMLTIRAMPQPVIAQVHGIATAAGCQLVASCDLAIAADDTKFGVNGVNIGLFCSTPMVALTRAVPAKAAFEMLTTGHFITASKAESIGLINRHTEQGDLDRETLEFAETIAAKLGAVVRIGKRAFYDQAEIGIEQAYALTADVMVGNMMRDDTNEGITAFLEKRKPDWQS